MTSNLKTITFMLLAMFFVSCNFDSEEKYGEHVITTEVMKDSTKNADDTESADGAHVCNFNLTSNLIVDYEWQHDINTLRVTVEKVTVYVIEDNDTIAYQPTISSAVAEPSKYQGWDSLPEGLTSPERRSLCQTPLSVRHHNSFMAEVHFTYVIRTRNKITGEDGQYLVQNDKQSYHFINAYNGYITMNVPIRMKSIVIIATVDDFTDNENTIE